MVIIFDTVNKMSEEDKFLLGKKNSVTLAEFNLYKDTLLGGAVTIEDIPNKEFQKILSKEWKTFKYNPNKSKWSTFEYVFLSFTDKQMNSFINNLNKAIKAI